MMSERNDSRHYLKQNGVCEPSPHTEYIHHTLNYVTCQMQIDKIRQQIRADSYSMSIGEWISHFMTGVTPILIQIFKQWVRWSNQQSSNLHRINLGRYTYSAAISVSQRDEFAVVVCLHLLVPTDYPQYINVVGLHEKK